MNDWAGWLKEATRGESARSIASKIAVNRTTVSSWMRAERPPAEAVFRIARAYGADVLDGLRAAGWLTDDDFVQVLSQIRTRALIAELHGRAEGFEPSLWTDPNMLV